MIASTAAPTKRYLTMRFVLKLLLLIWVVSSQQDQKQYGNQLSHQQGEDDEEKRAVALDSLPPRVKDVKVVRIEHDEDGNELSEPRIQVEYLDIEENYNVVANVPRYFEHLSQERLAKEMDYQRYVKDGDGWSERVVLELFYYAVVYGTDHEPTDHDELPQVQKQMLTAGNWLKDDVSICKWDGVTCGCGTGCAQEIKTNSHACNMMHEIKGDEAFESIDTQELQIPPSDRVSKLDFTDLQFQGTLPSELYHLKYLYRLNLNDNHLRGTIPSTFGLMKSLAFMDIGVNRLTGTFPTEIALLNRTLEEFWCERNNFSATSLPLHLTKLTRLEFFDISENSVGGPLPTQIGLLSQLESLFLEENRITGTLPTELGLLTNLKVIDFGFNQLTGTLPTEFFLMKSLTDITLVSQKLEGTLPTELWRLTNLESLILSQNRFSGAIPSDPQDDTKDVSVRGWTKLSNLGTLALDRNQFSGKLPPDMFIGLGLSLTGLDIGFNQFTGTLPVELGYASLLERISAPSNKLSGTIPEEIKNLAEELVDINLTANLLIGTVPSSLCDTSYHNGVLIEEFGCDAVLCPPGTFHPEGAASMSGVCQPCLSVTNEVVEGGEVSSSLLLGRTSCEGVSWMRGDMNADGAVSPREALRMLYINTCLGWDSGELKVWKNMNVNECSLPGITCANGEVTKIELASSVRSTECAEKECLGLPPELSLLSSLEAVVISNQKELTGSIPSEFGLLKSLRLLDLSNCPKLSSAIPSEVGSLTNLRVMHLYGTNLTGKIPDEVFSLSLLEKLNLSQTRIGGTLPTIISGLRNLRELMLSRSLIRGSIPSEIGQLSLLENLELYSNVFTGQLPDTIGNCQKLRRADLFNNKFRGTIPASFGSNTQIQILHLKRNSLTGTIPASLGALPHLSWFDASSNLLDGVVPPFESSQIADLRLGGNRLYDPIPPSLCSSPRINGGHTKEFGCDAILCPLGTYSDAGFASDSVACSPCPPGETTMYLGSDSCLELSEEDILSIFYQVMHGEDWPAEHQEGWKNPEQYKSACEWSGITCDENGEIISMSFPVSTSEMYSTRTPASPIDDKGSMVTSQLG